MSELRDKALAEGVSFGGDKPAETKAPAETAAPDANTADSSSANTDTQQDGAAKPVSENGRLPFHKDPEVQSYLDKMNQKAQREWEKKFNELNEKYTQQLELFNQQRAAQGKPEVNQLPPEQEEALNKLAELLFNNQSIREKYGLNKVDKTESEIESIRQERALESYNQEIQGEAGKLAEKFGGTADEWKEKLEEFYLSDPWLAEKTYERGVMAKVAKLYTADNSSDLAERSANLKLVKEQKEKKAQNSTQVSPGAKSTAITANMTLKERLTQRVQEAGGIKF